MKNTQNIELADIYKILLRQDENIGKIMVKLEEHDKRFEEMDKKIEEMDIKFERKFEEMDKKIDKKIKQQTNEISRFILETTSDLYDKLDKRIERLEKKVFPNEYLCVSEDRAEYKVNGD